MSFDQEAEDAAAFDRGFMKEHRRAMQVSFTREAFEQDKERYREEIRNRLSCGYPDDDPLVERARRRIETCERVLSDQAYGLVDEQGVG